MTRRLLIFDTPTLEWLAQARATSHPADEWDLLLLERSSAWLEQQHATELNQLGTWRIVDLSLLATEAQARLAQFVVDFIERLPDMDLGGITLAQFLQTPEGTHWWYLPLSEKSPFRGDLVRRLYGLALAHLAIEQGAYAEVWSASTDSLITQALKSMPPPCPKVISVFNPVVPRSNILQRAVKYWRAVIRVIISASIAKVLARILPEIRSAPPVENAWLVQSFYPYWWINAYQPEAMERFFSQIPSDHPIVFLVWLTNLGQLWRRRKAMGVVARRNRMVPLQMWVSSWAIARLINPRVFFRTIRFKPQLVAEFCGFDISAMIYAEVGDALVSADRFTCQLFQNAFENIARTADARGLLYRVEYQPWENALLRGIGKHLPVVGFLHSPFGRNYLPMRFASRALARYSQNSQPERDRPLPHFMLVSGSIGAQWLTADGFPATRIAVCGPQRHADLLAYLQRREPRSVLRQRLGLPVNNPIIFVAIAVVEADTEALFAALARLDADLGDFRLLVKTHPAKPLGSEAMQAMFTAVGTDRASVTPPGGGMHDYIAAADALVCIGSTIAFEAMALGIMPIVFENPATYAATSLAEFESALFIARNAAQLSAALRHTLRHTPEAHSKQQMWPTTLHAVFHDLDTPLAQQLQNALSKFGVSL